MKRRMQLQVEELGARILPSVPAPTLEVPTLFAPPKLLVTSGPVPVRNHHLLGAGRGVFTRQFVNPETGLSFHLQGAGTFNYLGRATITGDLQSGGLNLLNHARGTVTLTNARGSLTLGVAAPMKSSFGPLPRMFTYHIVSGTGLYTNWRDHGTLILNKRFNSGTGGTFRMTLV